MKAYCGMEIGIHTFLTSALERGEWSASLSGRLTLWEGAPGAHRRGGAVGARFGLGFGEETFFAVTQPR